MPHGSTCLVIKECARPTAICTCSNAKRQRPVAPAMCHCTETKGRGQEGRRLTGSYGLGLGPGNVQAAVLVYSGGKGPSLYWPVRRDSLTTGCSLVIAPARRTQRTTASFAALRTAQEWCSISSMSSRHTAAVAEPSAATEGSVAGAAASSERECDSRSASASWAATTASSGLSRAAVAGEMRAKSFDTTLAQTWYQHPKLSRKLSTDCPDAGY